MPLTKEQVQSLQATQSTYGCGAHDCVRCYPIQYSCEWCETVWESPIANGEEYTCPECSHPVSYFNDSRAITTYDSRETV